MCLYMYRHGCVYRPKVKIWCLPHSLSTLLLLLLVSSWIWNLNIWLNWSVNEYLGSHLFPPAPGWQVCCIMPRFCHGCWGLNSCSRACLWALYWATSSSELQNLIGGTIKSDFFQISVKDVWDVNSATKVCSAFLPDIQIPVGNRYKIKCSL